MKRITRTVLAGLLLVPVLALATSAFSPTVGPVLAEAEGGIRGGAETARVDNDQQPETLFGDNGIFTNVINVLLFIIGVISVIMIIVGGVRYAVSGGSAEQVKGAKNTIMYAIIGVVIAILAYAIVNFVLGSLIGA